MVLGDILDLLFFLFCLFFQDWRQQVHEVMEYALEFKSKSIQSKTIITYAAFVTGMAASNPQATSEDPQAFDSKNCLHQHRLSLLITDLDQTENPDLCISKS